MMMLSPLSFVLCEQTSHLSLIGKLKSCSLPVALDNFLCVS